MALVTDEGGNAMSISILNCEKVAGPLSVVIQTIDRSYNSDVSPF